MEILGLEMQYSDFIAINLGARNYIISNNLKNCLLHIEKVVLPYDRKHYEMTNIIVTKQGSKSLVQINIVKLLKAVISNKLCISNPSKLKNWKGWNSTAIKINNNVKLNKADFKRKKRQEIISNNWNSINSIKNSTQNNNDIILYHGSRDGIIGNISPSSREKCDFGIAFYAGDLREQAELLIKDNGTMKIIYEISIDTSGLNIFRFDDKLDNTEWALYIAAKRGKIDLKKCGRLNELISKIDKHDIIIGLIADDEMTEAFNEFIADSITDKALAYCLSKVNLGHQYAFKTQKACDKIRYIDIGPINKNRLKLIQDFHNNMIQSKSGVVDYAKNNIYDGKRLSQIIKEWQ